MAAFQDQIPDNFCFGCGADNPDGLHLKSEWEGDIAVARWTPWPSHAAGPKHILNGGIIATLLDCHGVCTAIDAPLLLRATVVEVGDDGTVVDCSLTSAGKVRAEARVTSVQVPESWRHGA